MLIYSSSNTPPCRHSWKESTTKISFIFPHFDGFALRKNFMLYLIGHLLRNDLIILALTIINSIFVAMCSYHSYLLPSFLLFENFLILDLQGLWCYHFAMPHVPEAHYNSP